MQTVAVTVIAVTVKQIYPPESDDEDKSPWWYVLFSDGERLPLTEAEVHRGMCDYAHWLKNDGGGKASTKRRNSKGRRFAKVPAPTSADDGKPALYCI
jgi:hypothetical protein